MRFELSEGTSNKFWEIVRDGKVLRLRWGRIGTDGQRQDKTFSSPDAALKEHDKLVASKRKKGYAEASAALVNGTNGVTEKAPQRDESLMILSSLGQMGADLDTALKYKDRTRYVDTDAPSKKLLQLTAVTRLDVSGALPDWIGELRHLRTLVVHGALTKLPPSFFKLPHLRFVHLDYTNLKSLDGVENMKALDTVTFNDTPLGEDEAGRPALAKKLGAKVGSFGASLEWARKKVPAPRDKKKLIAAFAKDELPDESVLRKVDLSGATFENLYVTHDLTGANLAGTTWRGCDFEWGTLARADLSGATFYDCYFSARYADEGNLGKVKAHGATFIGCGGDLQLDGADLRGARFVDMDSDYHLEIKQANASGAVIEASFCSEKEHAFEAKGADLRGARVRFDITPDRRAELKKKKTARLAWKTDHLKGAKTDKTTQIEYAALDPAAPAPATRPAEQTVKATGSAAPILGHLAASNASLWMIVADAEAAKGWRGAVDDDDKHDDFRRALNIEDAPIKIGEYKGICARIGFRGISSVFQVDGGVVLLDAQTHLDNRKAGEPELARRVAQWPKTKRSKIGTVNVPSGLVVLALPYREGMFSTAELAKARGGKVVQDKAGDRILIPMKKGPGIYTVSRYPFRAEPGKGEYEDDIGEYGDAVEVVFSGKLTK
jgi:predicted DNA-binding WGR domain protein/uncharacterized protein YjbI with pentapeptide repeats